MLAGVEAPDDAADVPVPIRVEDNPDVDDDVDCNGWASPCSA
jgi:hypothetical protein